MGHAQRVAGHGGQAVWVRWVMMDYDQQVEAFASDIASAYLQQGWHQGLGDVELTAEDCEFLRRAEFQNGSEQRAFEVEVEIRVNQLLMEV